MAEMRADAPAGRACVECGVVKPADYANWRGPGSKWCSTGKCRRAATAAAKELGGGCEPCAPDSRDERIAELKAHVAAQAEIIAMLKQQIRGCRCDCGSSGMAQGEATMERVVPQVRLKMAGLDAGGKRARTQPEAAAAAPAQARAPLALRDANAVAERPAKQSKAAELPPGWSTRLSSTTGKPVWEYKEFGLRLDSGPPTLLRDGVPHIHYSLIYEIMDMLRANKVKPISSQRIGETYRQCMGLADATSHQVAFKAAMDSIREKHARS